MPKLTLPLSLVIVLSLPGCSEPSSEEAPVTGPAPSESAAVVPGSGTVDDPVRIPRTPGEMNVDADPGDWAGVAALPAPHADYPDSALRLAWGPDGLYGLAEVSDADIEVDAFAPWNGDCVELFIEKDFARAMDRTENTAQYVFAPDPDAEGECFTVIPYGGSADREDELVCSWRPGENGYILEFRIPAELLAPASMEPGTKMGLNYAFDNGGVPVEQFYTDKDENEAYRKPSLWGAVILAE